jgi:hypothetical protein
MVEHPGGIAQLDAPTVENATVPGVHAEFAPAAEVARIPGSTMRNV